MNIENSWIKAGALVAAFAAALGAFDLQPLGETKVQPDADFAKAIVYQMVHGLAIVAVGILMVLRPGRLLRISGYCFLVGTLLFSGSIYLMLLTGMTWLEYTQLLGVVVLVFAWFLLVEGACPGWNRKKEKDIEST